MGLARLEVSFDAFTAETYSKIRKGKKAVYEDLLRNTMNFLDIREKKNSQFPTLRVSMVVLDVNRHELEDFVAFWKRHADYFSIQQPVNWKMNLPNTEVTFEEPSLKEHFRCDKQHLRIYMRYDGTILPCFHINHEDFDAFHLGKFPETSLYEAWHSDFINGLRKLHRENRYQENPVCKDCVMHCAQG